MLQHNKLLVDFLVIIRTAPVFGSVVRVQALPATPSRYVFIQGTFVRSLLFTYGA